MVTEYRQGFMGGAKSFWVQRKDEMLEIQKSRADRSLGSWRMARGK